MLEMPSNDDAFYSRGNMTYRRIAVDGDSAESKEKGH